MDYNNLRQETESVQIDLETRKQLLKKQAFFAKLTDDELEILATLLVEVHAHPQEMIVKHGDRVDSVYIIVKGSADVQQTLYQDQVPHTVSLAKLQDGAAIGLNETGFFSLSGKRTASVVALTEMTLLRLSVAAFHGFALSNPHVHEVLHGGK